MEPGKDAANTLALLFFHMRFHFVASVVYRAIMSYWEVYEHGNQGQNEYPGVVLLSSEAVFFGDLDHGWQLGRIARLGVLMSFLLAGGYKELLGGT